MPADDPAPRRSASPILPWALLRSAALRGVLLGGGTALVLVGIALARGRTSRLGFLVTLGLLLGAVAAALSAIELVARARARTRAQRAAAATTLALVAWVGAGAAFLQACYTMALLSDRSTDRAFGAVASALRSSLEVDGLLVTASLAAPLALTFVARLLGGRPWQQLAVALPGSAVLPLLGRATRTLNHSGSDAYLAIGLGLALLVPGVLACADRLERRLGWGATSPEPEQGAERPTAG